MEKVSQIEIKRMALQIAIFRSDLSQCDDIKSLLKLASEIEPEVIGYLKKELNKPAE